MKLLLASFIVASSTKSVLARPETSTIRTDYHFVIKPTTNNDYSFDCQDLRKARRYLVLVEDILNPQSTGPSLPGPTIEANEGDIIRVKVTNNNPFTGSSVHWHGIHQLNTQFMDGVTGITQCQLQPKSSQEFEFEAYPPGTHLWHGHFGMNVADGIAGAIIVHPRKPEPFEYDEDVPLLLTDFWTDTGIQQGIGLLSYPFMWVFNPQSLLIGGKGIAPFCESGEDEERCLPNCGNDPLNQLMIIKVERGKTYRLRFIQGALLMPLNIAIAGHSMKIVEIEGTNTEPFVTSNFTIGPGQRTSVLLEANQPSGSYWLETTTSIRGAPDLIGRAIIQYDDADDAVPEDRPEHPPLDQAGTWIEHLKASDPEDDPSAYRALSTPENEIKRFILVPHQVKIFDEETGKEKGLAWAVNNVTFEIPLSNPLLGSSIKATADNGWPTDIPDTVELPDRPLSAWDYAGEQWSGSPATGVKGTTIIHADKDQVFEFVFQNTFAFNGVSEYHPWHIHGHRFWVVGQGEGNWEESDIASYNLMNPVLRDTANQWPASWTAVRVIFDNPGVWFFHCHIAAHLEMGMALAFVVEPNEMEDFPNLSDSTKYCQASNSLDIAEPDKDGLGKRCSAIKASKPCAKGTYNGCVWSGNECVPNPNIITVNQDGKKNGQAAATAADVTEDHTKTNASPITGLGGPVMNWGVTGLALIWFGM